MEFYCILFSETKPTYPVDSRLYTPYRSQIHEVFLSQSRNSPDFMEPENSLPHSQHPACCPYPEPDQSSPCPHIPLLEEQFYPLLYCCNSRTSLHFKTLKSHTKTLKILPYMFRSPLKPSSGGPWPYFARLLNWNVDLHSL